MCDEARRQRHRCLLLCGGYKPGSSAVLLAEVVVVVEKAAGMLAELESLCTHVPGQQAKFTIARTYDDTNCHLRNTKKKQNNAI